MNAISQISADLIPVGTTEFGVHRDRMPLRLGKATVKRDEKSLIIHGKVAGVVNAELTIALDPDDPQRVTATSTRYKLNGTLTQESGNLVFKTERGTVTLRSEKKRLYVQVEGFGTSGFSSYYLSR